MKSFEELLAQAEAMHGHVCAGQVLGVRMAMRGCTELGIDVPDEGKRLIVYLEIDRCAADAIAAVTGCRLGRRTLKYVDYGKMAATFMDTKTGRAVRVIALEESREHARKYADPSLDPNEMQILAYRIMSDDELMAVEEVSITLQPEDMPGPPKSRVMCDRCGEGINDGREVRLDGRVLCRACAKGAYYRLVHPARRVAAAEVR
jgi:formylmethanofuran dehydrogenase subunit E